MLGRLFQLLSAQKPSQSPPRVSLAPLLASRPHETPQQPAAGLGSRGYLVWGWATRNSGHRVPFLPHCQIAEFGVHTPSLGAHGTHFLASGSARLRP